MIRRTRSRVRTVAVALGLSFTLVAAACGDDDDAGSDTDTDTDTASEATDLGSADTAGSSDSTQPTNPNGTLVYGAANIVTRFDPHKSSNGYDQNWLAPVYERLMWQTPDVELRPGLATKWRFIDDKTFEVTLRKGVKFHDGEPFNAEVVAANIDRAKNVEGSGVHAYLESVDEVKAIDDYTAHFILNRPDATLPMQLATRPGMMLSPKAFDSPDLDVKPVGTGPFKLVSYAKDDRAIYERNPDYWDKSYAAVERLEIVYLAEASTRLNALRSGQVDATVLDVNQIDEAEGADLNVDIVDTIEVNHFQMDRTKSEFGDVRVRQALSHAIDREAIVEGLMLGHAKVATQWVPEGTPYYADDIGESTTYDPELSRELLAEAGLEDGFEFDALTSVQPHYVQLAAILQGQFEEIGVTMNIGQDPVLADTFFGREATNAIVSAYPGRIDPAETAQIYFNDESFSNPGRHVTEKVKQAWIDSLQPGADRAERLKDLSRAIDDDMLGIPILHPQIGLAYNDEVQGLTWYLSGHIEFKGVGVNK